MPTERHKTRRMCRRRRGAVEERKRPPPPSPPALPCHRTTTAAAAAAAIFVVLLLMNIATIAVAEQQQQQHQQQKADLRRLATSTIQMTPTATTTESIRTVDEANRAFVQSLRIKALHNLQRSLESLSSLTANSLMLNAAFQSSETPTDADDDDDAAGEAAAEDWEVTQSDDANTLFAANAQIPSANGARRNGILRIRADLKEMPLPLATINDDFGTVGGGDPSTAVPATTTAAATAAAADDHAEQLLDQLQQSPSTRARHLRSAAGRHHHHHHHQHSHHRSGTAAAQQPHAHVGGSQQQHRRRRKGCPTVQGKDQLLCPTRNSQRYDVCITRDQLCDRQRDCPGGEDEDSRHCFFYRPLEHSLKTISHAVLLLVDTVMREQEEHQQQQQRNEL